MRGTVMTLSSDLPVQHRNAVLHVPAPGGWGGWQRGVLESSADAGRSATVLQGRATHRGAELHEGLSPRAAKHRVPDVCAGHAGC